MRTIETKRKAAKKCAKLSAIFVTRFYANVWIFQEATSIDENKTNNKTGRSKMCVFVSNEGHVKID